MEALEEINQVQEKLLAKLVSKGTAQPTLNEAETISGRTLKEDYGIGTSLKLRLLIDLYIILRH